MSKRRPRTLAAEVRRRLVFWMLLPGLCAVLALGAGAAWVEREGALRRQAVVAEAAGLLVYGYVAAARGDLRHCLTHIEKNPGRAAGELMAMLLDSYRIFDRLLLLDPEGRVLEAAPAGGEGARFPVQSGPEDGQGRLGPTLSPFTGLPAVHLSVAGLQDRRLAGELSLSGMQEHVSRFASLVPGEEMILTDRFGSVLAHPDLELVRIRANLGGLDILGRARKDGPVSGEFMDRGVRRIGTVVTAPGTGWLLLVTQPAAAVYGPIAAAALSLLALLTGLFLLLAFLTERTLRRRVVEPVAGFTAAVQDLARGRGPGDLPEYRPFLELSLLQDEFNAARAAIAARDAALRASEAKYRDIFENAVEGLFQSTPDGRYVSANPALARILGYGSPAELMAGAADIRTQVYVNPEDRDVFLRRLDAQGEVRGLDVLFRRRDGQERWCSVNARAVRDGQGRLALIEGAVEDITGRKQAEESLRASLAEKEVLLKEVHHRVKNNLQVVSGLLYLQADHLADPAARAALAESQGRIASMALAHQALYGSPDLARVDLREYADQLLPRLAASLGVAGVEFDVNVSAVRLPLYKAVPCGLILNELVTNALKYAFANGVGRVTVRTWRENGLVVLSVADNGRGLPPNIDPQTASTLGLQLVANLTRQLKGELRVRRESGACFEIRFPLEGD